MCFRAGRFLTCVAALAFALAATPTMAVQLFYEDFTDGVLNAGETAPDSNYGVPAAFYTANQNVGGGGKLYGTNAQDANINTSGGGGNGWKVSVTPKAVDLINKVMFTKVSYVSDAYDTAQNYAGSDYWFYCDVIGKRGTSNVAYYPAACIGDSERQTIVQATPPSAGQVLQNSNNLMIPFADPVDPATVSPRLDGVFTNTYVFRGASTDGKTLTTEVTGNNGSKKATTVSSSAIAMDSFTGLKPTLALHLRAEWSGTDARSIYSNVSGQTNFAPLADLDLTQIKMGWTKFEVGETKSTDFNFSYTVDTSDFNIMKTNMFTGSGEKTMSQGDATNNGIVDTSDFNALKTDMFTSADEIKPAADAISGNKIPNLKYNPTNGQLTVSTDAMLSTEGLYSINIQGPEALTIVPGRSTTGIFWNGGIWAEQYYDGKEQWADWGGANLNTSGGDLLIATYAAGLNASAFGTVEYGAYIGSSNTTGYTGVNVVPEPGTLVLLAMAGGAAFVAMVLRRRK